MSEEVPAPHEYVSQPHCKACRKAYNVAYYAANKEVIAKRHATYRSANKKAIAKRHAAYSAVYHAAHREAIHEYKVKWRAEHREETAEYKRQKWQRTGRGIHMARCADWSAFFDSLASDQERSAAAYVMMALAPFDAGTRSTVRDRSFDYNVIAVHTNI